MFLDFSHHKVWVGIVEIQAPVGKGFFSMFLDLTSDQGGN